MAQKQYCLYIRAEFPQIVVYVGPLIFKSGNMVKNTETIAKFKLQPTRKEQMFS